MVLEKVLAVIEEAYPNSLTIDDMARRFKSETELVRNMVLELVSKKLVKPVGAGVPGAAGRFSFREKKTVQIRILKFLYSNLEKKSNFSQTIFRKFLFPFFPISKFFPQCHFQIVFQVLIFFPQLFSNFFPQLFFKF
jgi:hypothetical protein